MNRIIPCVFIAVLALGLALAACDNGTVSVDNTPAYKPLVIVGKDSQSKKVEIIFSTTREAPEEGESLSKLESGDSYVIKLDGKTISEGTITVTNDVNIVYEPKGDAPRFQGSYTNSVLKFVTSPSSLSGFLQDGQSPSTPSGGGGGGGSGNNGGSTPAPTTYTVTFDKNGGDSEADPKTITVTSPKTEVGTKEDMPTPPERDRYTFKEWNTQKDGKGIPFIETTPVTASLTVYAMWELITYTVSFAVDGDPFGTPREVPIGDKISAPNTAPTKDGHSFEGWYKDAELETKWDFGTDTVTENITLHAKWTLNTYTVTFNANGGDAVAAQSVAHGGKISEPSSTRQGYIIEGWYREGTPETKWNFADDTVSASITLHAKWTQNTYTVTFDSKGGSAVAGQTVAYGGTISEPADPTKEGNTFEGWYEDDETFADEWNFGTDTVTANTTLHAKWNINQYTVTFDVDGGSTVADQTVAYGGTITKPVPDPTKSGYSFKGWYEDDEPFADEWNFTSAVTKDMTLYAKFELTVYTVSYNANGGIGEAPEAETVTPGTTITVQANSGLTRNGFTFGGWNTQADGNGDNYAENDTFTPSADTTLYAKWNPLWASVSAGAGYTVAIKTDGTLWAWGNNSSGQLGDGTTTNSPITKQIGSDSDWAFVSVAKPENQTTTVGYTMAIKKNGTLWAWGANSSGQLGNGKSGSNERELSPVLIGSGWKSVSAGVQHTVGIKTDNSLWAWGNNASGQLGDGTAASLIPKRMGNDTWESVSAGYYHTVGIKTDGTLWAWGRNLNYGLLGVPSIPQMDKATPVEVNEPGPWASVSAASTHTMAIKTSGTLWAWGSNFNGQLGNDSIPTGSNSSQTSPVQVDGPGPWASVSAGYLHTVGIKTDGSLWAWGNNNYGQVGNASITPGNHQTAGPIQVDGPGPWASVSAGQDHTVGIKTDGTLWGWGRNNSGQLGNNDPSGTSVRSPVQIP